jgi:hypothetical protein
VGLNQCLYVRMTTASKIFTYDRSHLPYYRLAGELSNGGVVDTCKYVPHSNLRLTTTDLHPQNSPTKSVSIKFFVSEISFPGDLNSNSPFQPRTCRDGKFYTKVESLKQWSG